VSGQDASRDDRDLADGADGGYDEQAERLRSWYTKQTVEPRLDEETIGLLGSRREGGTSRRARYERMMQMVAIVRKYDILRGLTPTTLRRMLEELGPTFVKAGQILSMRSEILPESFCNELAKLRTEVEPMPRELMLDTLRAEYDVPIEQIFDAIDDVPLGSASVAQVHKGRLVTGEVVAIKIQRAGVREVMAKDIDIMRSIARYATRFIGDDQFLDINSVVEELWQSFREETDFLVEQRSLVEFRRNNANCAFVSCPKTYPGLCTEHVVVMEYIEGVGISKVGELTDNGYDLDEIGVKLVDNYAQQVIDDGFFHADPHPGNIVVSGGRIVYLDLGMMGRLSSNERAALSQMVFAVADLDTPRIKDGLLRFSVGKESAEIDHARLLADIDAIVEDFGTTSLADFDIAQFLSAVVTLARRSGIELPSSVTMLARSLVTLEGTVDDLLADRSIVDILAQHVSSHVSRSDLAIDEAKLLAKEVRRANHGLLGAASDASLAMKMLTRGQLRMKMDVPGSEDPIADFSHAFDRLTMGIVIAGLFIGSSVIYYSGVKPLLFGVPLLGFVGFVVAFALGVWLFVDIMREGRRHR
jgi:ubiquinone biosynthesis protein